MADSLSCLEAYDVRSLQALRTLGDFELNRLAIVQRLVTIPLNRGEVNENVLAGLALDESESLAGIEPLYCSLFFQLNSLFYFLSYLMPLDSLQPNTKKAASVCHLQPSAILKVSQEQQTHPHHSSTQAKCQCNSAQISSLA